MEQTGSAGELSEGRKNVLSVLKWDCSELTFPVCSAHVLLGLSPSESSQADERGKRKFCKEVCPVVQTILKQDAWFYSYLFIVHLPPSGKSSQLSNAQAELRGEVDGLFSFPTSSLSWQQHWLSVWETQYQQVLEMPWVCTGLLQGVTAQN